ncbi:13393_t:CDS:2, partial [Gigaspora rosea]
PSTIEKIIKDYVFEKPSPSSTTYTQPVKTWTVSTQNKCKEEFMNQANIRLSMNSDEDSVLINSENITDMDIDASLRGRWAFQENLKVNHKDPVKRLTEKVKGLLGVMFHSGVTNTKLKMDAAEMHMELLRRAQQCEIKYQNVLKVSTIANWIKRTSRAVKQSMALQFLDKTE